jgi:hypothetical protein
MGETSIPAVLFISISVVAISFFYWNHKSRQAVLETVQKSIKAGNGLTPDMLVKLGGSFAPRVRDLRRGIVILFFGVAGMIASMFPDVSDLVTAMRMVSVFPVMVGAGFLLVWKLDRYSE